MKRFNSILLPALLCWALPAAGQDAPPPATTATFSITAKAKSAKVALGGEIELEITVKNEGEAESLARPVALSTHSVMIELSGARWGEAKRYLARFPGGIAKLKPQAQVGVAPGKTLTGTIKLPTVETGKITIKRGDGEGYHRHSLGSHRPNDVCVSQHKV